MNVLDNQVELLFLDHDHLPARTLRVDRRTMLLGPWSRLLVNHTRHSCSGIVAGITYSVSVLLLFSFGSVQI
jgi:hypothetical protein